MPASDFLECMLYDQMEPFGELRGDLQAGTIASTIANIHRDKNRKAYSVTDFMPFTGKKKSKPVQQTPEEMHASFLAFKKGYETFLSEKKPS